MLEKDGRGLLQSMEQWGVLLLARGKAEELFNKQQSSVKRSMIIWNGKANITSRVLH